MGPGRPGSLARQVSAEAGVEPGRVRVPRDRGLHTRAEAGGGDGSTG